MKFAKGILLLALVMLPCRQARADQASEAQLQFELGSELYKQGRYVEAIDRFVASNRLAPNPNVVLNVAQTFAFLKRPLDAYNWYSTYLAFQLPDDKRAQGEAARQVLAPLVAVLDIASEPAGAELFVDRLELGSVGRAPRKVAVEPGSHRVVARLPGHHDSEAVLPVEVGRLADTRLVLSPILGRLAVRSHPPGAHVRLDRGSVDLGVTPLAVSLPIGESRLIISATGYVEQARLVNISESQPVILELSLGREASSVSVLSVKGNLPGAEVWIDGAPVGRAPFSLPDITPGARSVSIRAAGRETWTGVVPFEPGAATRLDYRLVDPSTRAWKGWRYVGYALGGALLASGGVTGLVALDAHHDFNQEPTAAGLKRLHKLDTVTDVLLASGLVVAGGTLVWDLFTPIKHSEAHMTLSR